MKDSTECPSLFHGSNRVGKTHLTIGISVEACRHGHRTMFINCHELLLQVKTVAEGINLERVVRHYARYKLLIIDNPGYLPIRAEDMNDIQQSLPRMCRSQDRKKSCITRRQTGLTNPSFKNNQYKSQIIQGTMEQR